MRQELKEKLLKKTKDGKKSGEKGPDTAISITQTTEPTITLLIRLCLSCDHLAESCRELERCPHCQKSFLPINYLVHDEPINAKDFAQLFKDGKEITEDDLIRGIFVIW